MVKQQTSFCSLKAFKALVIGDFMLDTYTTGKVRRISPEAPVPVMEVSSQESRPGGAGNVALNLMTLGGQVIAIGRVGEDLGGSELLRQLSRIDTSRFVLEKGYQTPVKNRLISDSQQLLRIDFETTSALKSELEERVMAHLHTVIPLVDVVAISDYGKGFLTPSILQAAIQIAKDAQIPLIVDPKGTDFSKYQGAGIIKPNLSEAYAAAKLPLSASLDEVAEVLLETTGADLLVITRSEEGLSLFNRAGRSDFPVRSKEVKDVTGAGDTVLATLCAGLANDLDLIACARLANVAAGISIERLGCVQVTLSEMLRRLVELDLGTKVFDEAHTFALQHVLKDSHYALLVLNPGQQMNNLLFRTIRELASRNLEVVIYLKEAHPDDELVKLLASLNEVNFIIFQTQSLKHLCETLHPTTIFYLEKDSVQAVDLGVDLLTKLQRQSATT